MSANYNPWSEMFKASQTMMNAWVDAMPKPGAEKKEQNNVFDFGMYENWFKLQQMWMENWQNFMENTTTDNMPWFQSPYSAWSKMVDFYNPFEAAKFMDSNARDVFEKMMNSNKLYLGIYEQWDKFNEAMKSGSEGYKESMDKMVEQFNSVFMNNMIPLLPKEIQGLMTDSQSYLNTYMGTLQNFIGPWAASYQKIGEIFMEAVFKDRDPMKLSDALREWKSAYDQTFGVMVKSPVVGSAREILEQNNRAVDAMVEMLITVGEYMTKSLSVAYKYSKEAFEEYYESLQKGETPKTFNEFYKMWSKRVEDAIETYFYTDEFSNLIAKTADSAMIFKIEFDKVIEKTLETSPIVTKSEVDNLYKKVQELKREVRTLKNELEQVRGSAEKPAEK